MASAQPLPMPSEVPVQPAPAAPAPKHRACDECRARKLACTKEPDGCSRCKRESITCHYSLQKPMGRPRKRPREDNTVDAKPAVPDEEPAAKTTMAQIPPNVADPGMGLIDLLLSEENLYDMSSSLDFMGLSSQTVMPDFNLPMEPIKDTTTTPFQFQWGGDVGDLDFGLPGHSHGLATSDLEPAFFMTSTDTPPPAEQVPALSPNTNNSASNPDSPATTSTCTTVPKRKCACSASLYLALSSLQNLENDVAGGVRQARLAAKTAYEVVNCTVCSARIDTMPQLAAFNPMQGFQNMMLLATLIPSLVHAYSEILRLVDAEAQRARAERRQLVFMLDGLGGIWGGLGNEGSACDTGSMAKQYQFREMDPTLWRLTVRALLKIDVYGLSHNKADPTPTAHCEPFHLGLRDIVNLMDAKSKARHAYMDTMVANGVSLSDCGENVGFKLHEDGETPTCQKVIEIARRSIDTLVIP
ncbi:uncharacterized protein B0I36DRAFT_87380 [Microdochium trichocladiopsis]|uniref:Zn(2)-C6 fungal-type domain-containing protein n=1 Tax=Microdochium trichocladiopsis TaxID=1682393 RepID=A0A9P8YBX4_9PEZI|nr:uncharacterized protein B0I36DRAFT_87380 [Microdochium trichocladiopsis]KAH7035060.1 hypothetical protein B0I36DRAFT_87380 [Microdochium trichocladiopsis]